MEEQSQPLAVEAKVEAARRRYAPPRLTVHGDVATLTTKLKDRLKESANFGEGHGGSDP